MLKSLWRDVRASLNRIFAIVVKEFAVTFGDQGLAHGAHRACVPADHSLWLRRDLQP